MPSSDSAAHKTGMLAKLGFHNHKQMIGFLTVVFSGQIIYSDFEAFKSVFYNVLLKMLHLNNTQLGMLFTLIGISVLLYIPAGWINNRFSVKSILIFSMMVRMLTMFVVILANPNYTVLRIIATIWGVIDAIFWPAVLNGITMLTDKKHRGVGFGLLESIRRLMEMVMNMALVGVMSLISGLAVFKGGMIVYNLLLLPLCILIYKYLPKNGISANKNTNSSEKGKDSLVGLGQVIKMPKLWIAAITALTIYWSYINIVYTVPYVQAVFHMSQTAASFFGTICSAGMGIVASFLSGILADNVVHSVAKMICIALSIVVVSMVVLLCLPQSQAMMWPSMIILLVFAYGMFTAKGIFMVPVSQIKMPEKYRGAAMSVSSFAAYAPKLFAYEINGIIIDKFLPVHAYRLIFTIEAIVALVGVLMSIVLIRYENKEKEAAAAQTAN